MGDNKCFCFWVSLKYWAGVTLLYFTPFLSDVAREWTYLAILCYSTEWLSCFSNCSRRNMTSKFFCTFPRNRQMPLLRKKWFGLTGWCRSAEGKNAGNHQEAWGFLFWCNKLFLTWRDLCCNHEPAWPIMLEQLPGQFIRPTPILSLPESELTSSVLIWPSSHSEQCS